MDDNTFIDTENSKNKIDINITTEIAEFQEDGEVLDDETAFFYWCNEIHQTQFQFVYVGTFKDSKKIREKHVTVTNRN